MYVWFLLESETRDRRWHPAGWGAAINHGGKRGSEMMRSDTRAEEAVLSTVFLLSRMKVIWDDGGLTEDAFRWFPGRWISETLAATFPKLSVSNDAWNSCVENSMDQAGRWLTTRCPFWFPECREVRLLWHHRVNPFPSNSRVLSLRTTQSPAGRAGIHTEHVCLPRLGLFSGMDYLKFIMWVAHSVRGTSSLGS